MDPSVVSIWIPVVLAVIGGVFAALKMWDGYRRDKRINDAALAEQLSNAIKNAVGTVQQKGSIYEGVQYVENQAEESVERFEQTTEKIIEKITAQIGLQEIATNLAVSGSATPVVAPPLTPIEVTAELNRKELERHA